MICGEISTALFTECCCYRVSALHRGLALGSKSSSQLSLLAALSIILGGSVRSVA